MSRHLAFVAAVALVGCATDEFSVDGPGSPGGGGKADDSTASFLASLPGWGRYIVLDQLDDIVPVYLAQTKAVIARIDAHPTALPASTPLDEVPIPDLFAAGQAALLEVLSDADFTGGRVDHDIAWLRQSAVDLEALRVAVTTVKGDGTSPASFNTHLTNESFWQGPNGALEINVGVTAVSRFYCNLDIRIVDGAQGFSVDASESCD